MFGLMEVGTIFNFFSMQRNFHEGFNINLDFDVGRCQTLVTRDVRCEKIRNVEREGTVKGRVIGVVCEDVELESRSVKWA